MAGGNPSSPVPVRTATSDLPKRAASAIIMLAVAIGALVAGDPWLDLFICAVAVATLAEFVLLVVRATASSGGRIAGMAAGALYIALAGALLTSLQSWEIAAVVGAVIFVDVFAYFFGRTLGGPKIAPRISPSKTWAGLLGGVVGASLFLLFYSYLSPSLCEALTANGRSTGPMTFTFDDRCHFGPNPSFVQNFMSSLMVGALVAVLAQAGDFFESWLKRRAGVKDSSRLIPGHGGVFDRVDGLLPVAILFGLLAGYA